MKDINKMRLGVLREIKNVHKFFEDMEKGVKSRDPSHLSGVYFYQYASLSHERRDLSPLDIELKQALLHTST